ncbi:MAG: GerMN domain-containing protein [Acidimicrobiales bacterium]
MRRTACCFVVLAFVLAACGVPSDDNPREIAADRLPDALSEGEPTASTLPEEVPGNRTAQVYFVAGGRLQAVQRDVTARNPDDVLGALFAGLGASDVQALSTLIPAGLTLENWELEDESLIIVDLSSEINDVAGENQKLAYAQMVYTLIDLRGVIRVRFRVDEVNQEVPTDTGGESDPVDRGDFDSVAPPTDV